jgi:ABC-type sugar transport system permease subunit/ABC-type glycerol-3-phosphate transport system substrate-binding protein
MQSYCLDLQRRRALILLVIFGVFLLPSVLFADSSQIVLRLRYWGDTGEIKAIQGTIAAFEHDHPGIIVHGERVTSTGDEYVQKLMLEKAAGLTPDVIFMGNNYTKFADRGLLQDINPFLKRDPSVQISKYYPEDVKAFTFRGKLYALPRDIAPMGNVFYNKSLFDKAGIPYPDGNWSWDYVPHPERGNKDFLNVAEKLTRRGPNGQPIVFGYGCQDSTWEMNLFVFSSGGKYVDNILKPTKMYYNSPLVEKAMQLTANTMFKYNISPSAVDLLSSAVDSHALFAQGRIAMYVGGIWDVPRFRNEITNFDWDIAAFPKGPTGLRGVPVGFSGYGISATTKYPQESWELIKYLGGPKGMTLLAKPGLAQPAIASLANSTLWLDGKRPVNRKLTIEEVPYVHFEVMDPDWDQVKEIIDAKLQLVWSDAMTPQEAINDIMTEGQAKLDTINHPAYHPLLNWWYALAAVFVISFVIVGWVWQGAAADVKSGRQIGRRSEARAGYLFISPWIIGALVFLTAPMLISLVLAFCSWDMIEPAKWVGFSNFVEMAKDEQYIKSLTVTMIYTLVSVPLGVVGSLLLALLLHTKIRGQGLWRTLYYLPAVASTVAVSLIWMRIFNPESGLVNYFVGVFHMTPMLKAMGLTDPVKGYVDWLGSEKTALGSLIVMSLWGVGGGMVIYLAGLQGIPQSYYEAADIDGANVWQKFFNVTLPLLTPTIFFTLIIGFIASFQIFTQGFMMTQGGPNNATLFYVLYLYENAFEFLKIGYASAMAWILFIIILVFTMLQMKMSRWVHYEAAETK